MRNAECGMRNEEGPESVRGDECTRVGKDTLAGIVGSDGGSEAKKDPQPILDGGHGRS
jgi:hypothetical protein